MLGKKSASLSIYASAVESNLRNSSPSAQPAETELESRRIGSEFFSEQMFSALVICFKFPSLVNS